MLIKERGQNLPPEAVKQLAPEAMLPFTISKVKLQQTHLYLSIILAVDTQNKVCGSEKVWVRHGQICMRSGQDSTMRFQDKSMSRCNLLYDCNMSDTNCAMCANVPILN